MHRAAKCMPSATSDLPEPVGVFKIDMVAGQEVHNGLFLMRPWFDAFDVFHPAEESFVDVIGRKIPFASVAVPFGGQPPQGSVFLLVSHNAQST